MYYQNVTYRNHKGSLLLTPTRVVFFFASPPHKSTARKWSWRSIEKTLVNPDRLLIRFVGSQQQGKSITFAVKDRKQLQELREDAKRGCAKTNRRRRRLEGIERAERRSKAALLPLVLNRVERETEAAALSLAGHRAKQESDEEWLTKLKEEVKSMNEDTWLAAWKTELNAAAMRHHLEQAKERAEWLLFLEENDDISSLSSVVIDDDDDYEEVTVDEDDLSFEYEEQTVEDDDLSCASSLEDDAIAKNPCSEEEEDLSVWLERELLHAEAASVPETEQDTGARTALQPDEGEETGLWLDEQDALSREAAHAVLGAYQKGSELGDSDHDSSTVSLTSYGASYTTLDWEAERVHDPILLYERTERHVGTIASFRRSMPNQF